MGAGLGLPSHRGILMSFLARSDEGGGGCVMKTDDPRPALFIFLLEESHNGVWGVGADLPSAWVSSALAQWLSSCCWHPHPLSFSLATPPPSSYLSPPSSLLPALLSLGTRPFPFLCFSLLLISPLAPFCSPPFSLLFFFDLLHPQPP